MNVIGCPPRASGNEALPAPSRPSKVRLRTDSASPPTTPRSPQVFSTPVHILAVDKFEHPSSEVRARVAAIARGFVSVCTGRMMRVIPAFGVGSYLNTFFKETFNDQSLPLQFPQFDAPRKEAELRAIIRRTTTTA
jgi:hypothetical protein